MPDPGAAEGHAAGGEEEAAGGFLLEGGAGVLQVLFERFDRGAAEGDDALLVAFAADQGAAGVEREVGNAEAGQLGDAETGGVEQLEDGVVAHGDGVGLGMIGGEGGALHHGVDFGDSERFGQNFPGGGGFEVEGGIAADALVEEEPAEESAQAGELAPGGARLDAVLREVPEESGDVLLRGGEESGGVALEEFGELQKIALVRFAGERAQAFFDAQVGEVFADQSGVAEGGVGLLRFFRLVRCWGDAHVFIIEEARGRDEYPGWFGPGRAGSLRASGFAVVQQQDADEHEADGPDPRGNAALAGGGSAVVESSRRSSSQRPHPATAPRMAMGVWLSSAKTSSVPSPRAWVWVRRSAPPTAQSDGEDSIGRGTSGGGRSGPPVSKIAKTAMIAA